MLVCYLVELSSRCFSENMSLQDDYSNTCAFFILICFWWCKSDIKMTRQKSFFISLPTKHYAEDCIPPFAHSLLLCSINQKWGESKQTIQGEQSAVKMYETCEFWSSGWDPASSPEPLGRLGGEDLLSRQLLGTGIPAQGKDWDS